MYSTQKKGSSDMRKKIAMIMSLVLTISMALSGCGKTDEKASKSDKTEEKQEESGVVTLKVWGATEDQELLAELVESFKAEYADQAEFDITIEAVEESDCRHTLLADVQGGADVFSFADDQLLTLVAAGALVPVDNADEVKAANNEESVAAASVNDKLYAYPMTADNGYFMYYDKRVFSEADVASLDQMLSVAAAANKKVTMDWSSGWYLYSFFGNTGMTVGLNDDGVTTSCNWNSTEGAIKGTDVAQAMLAIAANPGFANMGDDGLAEGAKNGSVAAGISGVWQVTALEEAWGDNLGAVKLPTYTCAGQQVQMASFSGYKMVGVNAYSEYPEWGMKLADWITNEQNQQVRFEKRGQGPSNIKVASSEDVQNAPAIQAVLAQAEFATLQRIGNNYWVPVAELGEKLAAGNPEGTDLQELLDKTVKAVTASVVD